MRSAQRIDLVISRIDRTLHEYNHALSVDVPSPRHRYTDEAGLTHPLMAPDLARVMMRRGTHRRDLMASSRGQAHIIARPGSSPTRGCPEFVYLIVG